MPTVRNPLAGFALTIVGALGLSFLVGVPFILFVPQFDRGLIYFYLPFALFGAGFFAGRTTFLGSLGFLGGTLGGFIGIYAFQSLFVPQGWPLWPAWTFLITLGFSAMCGLGGLATGKLGLRRIDRMTAHAPKMRRWQKCGGEGGGAARQCWALPSDLPPTENAGSSDSAHNLLHLARLGSVIVPF